MYVNLYQLFTESFITNLYLVNRTDLIIGDNSWFELFTQHQHSFPPLWRVLNNNHRNILTLDTAITSIAQHNTAIPGSKTPEGIATKLEVRWLHPGPYLNFKIWQRSGCVDALGACTKYHCLWLSFVFFCFFRFFTSPTGRHGWPVSRQTTRFHARKCFLGDSMMSFHIYPAFCP